MVLCMRFFKKGQFANKKCREVATTKLAISSNKSIYTMKYLRLSRLSVRLLPVFSDWSVRFMAVSSLSGSKIRKIIGKSKKE